MTCRDCDRTLVPRGRGPVTDRKTHARHMGRGLCQPCWRRRKNAGTLLDVERLSRPFAETAAEWQVLQSQGYTRRQAAQKLEMTINTFERALARAPKEDPLWTELLTLSK